MFAALYGAGYLCERLKSIYFLRKLRLVPPRKYTLGFVKNAWGAPNVRWAQEIKAMIDTLRLRARLGRPTSQQLQAVGMAVVTATGATLFRRRDTFGTGALPGICVP